jgi:UDP-N-acetylmuramate dehydrogenase
MIWPRHPQAVGVVLEWCAARGLAWRVLGGGTNVLVSDRGVPEPVLNITALTDGTRIDDTRVLFPAGVTMAEALKNAARNGLAGLVWATGLPGTVGGAAAGNAGCWGGQMADVVARLDVIDSSGTWREMASAELTWAYRTSPLPAAMHDGAVIVAASLELQLGDVEELRRRSEELHAAKRAQQPIGARNAGCIFKNPDPEHPAGRLIDEAGCKGLRVGGAQISDLHGNFLINHGDATGADVDELITSVAKAVRERSGLTLQEEIHRW